jgi:type I restriction enzyme S subunit
MYKLLKDLITIEKGKKAQNIYIEQLPDTIPYIRIESFNHDMIIYTDATDMVSCTPDDILIVWDGARAGLSTFGHRGAIGSTIAKLEIKNKNEVHPKYLYQFISSKYVKLNQNTHGAAIPHLNKYYLEGLEIPLPPLPTQRRIATLLETCESAIQKRKEANRLTDEFLKSTFLEMFGDPVKNSKKWRVCEVADIAAKDKNSIKAGPFGSSLKKEYYVKKGYKIYGQEQVIRDDFTFGEYYIDEIKYQQLESNKIQAGDILISLVGTFGKISIVPENFEPGIINPRLMKITLNKDLILPIYLKSILTSASINAHMQNQSHGGTMGIVNVQIMKRINIPLPPLELQQKYANLIQKVERMKEKQRESEKELNNLFNSLIQRAFNGQL